MLSAGERALAALAFALIALLAGALGPAGASAALEFEAEWGERGRGLGQLRGPQGVAITPTGIAIADRANHRIVFVDDSGAFERTIGWGVRTGALEPEVCTAGCGSGIRGTGNGQFWSPYDVAVDGQSTYVAEAVNERVQSLFPNGLPDRPPVDADEPLGLTVTAGGQAIVAEPGQHRIARAFGPSSGTTLGSGSYLFPRDVATGPGGLAVADTDNNRVQLLDPAGEPQEVVGGAGTEGGEFMLPRSVAVDRFGAVYISDSSNNRIQKLSAGGDFLSSFGFGVSTGSSQFEVCREAPDCRAGRAGNADQPGDGQLTRPTGIAVADDGRIFVADSRTDRVQVLSQTGELSTSAALPVSLGSAPLGTTSDPVVIPVVNGGDWALQLDSAVLDGPQAAEFALASDSCSGVTLAAGDSCEVSVTVTPAANGTRNASLELDAVGSPADLMVPLVGGGETPALSFTPGAVQFPDSRPSPATPEMATVTVESTSASGPATVSSVSVTGADAGQFSAASTCPGAPLPQGSICEIELGFAPDAIGDFGAQLIVDSDAVGSPHAIALSGRATRAAAEADPTGLGFGLTGPNSENRTLRITVESTGRNDLEIADADLSGVDSAQFELERNCGAGPLNAGESCGVDVRFLPVGNGRRSASLRIFSNDPDSPLVVPLTGVADSRPPQLVIKGPRKTKKRRPVFRTRADEALSERLCRLNGGQFKSCGKRYKVPRKLRPGKHRLRVIATDIAGNRSVPRIKPFKITRRGKKR